ncbi:MAG: hypothetical protein A2900_01240 [Candidatus Chisholmbacteria bacterium RIFCSPLOWO2_01_FULL_50_28]|uniref:PqqD family protein n=1 Tax=Candidatus Chisholmbacteria bacterium RIFCSPHIGHO2_01_FULL_52_32 TaxID=1797591 RepID=A0A1G1VUN3_9BACT|nr:MAG: hypothetical protein A2786_06300 [Candidatus Chisholmbacteria bacterium RIFCSPHIGHO2_01_FULL_52_32]OGY19713.1 MAG: hypothetical protein A2900_01240 [Candidatus Chisholmbacteria bacterium RIFCSPLOWO2_01_FULL_50_28]
MIIKRNPLINSREAKDTLYVFDDKKMVLYTYSPVASFIWKISQRPISLRDIVQRVCRKYDIDSQTAKKDIELFIKGEIKTTKLFVPVND